MTPPTNARSLRPGRISTSPSCSGAWSTDVRDCGLGPICGRLTASLATPEQQVRIARGELIPGTQVGVEREDLLLLYTTVGHEFDDVPCPVRP